MSKLPRLTDEQKKKYKDSGGCECPYCEGTSIEGGGVEIDSNMAWQDVSCLDCGVEWRDVYEFRNIEEIDYPWENPLDNP